jgi:hypothetical protein
MLVNSMGKMYLVEGLAPIDLSVSKYCRVIVLWSMPLAALKIASRAWAKPSAAGSATAVRLGRRIALAPQPGMLACFSPRSSFMGTGGS